MALDLTGIENVEFYSGHYLDAVLEGDLKSVFKNWKQAKDEDSKRQPQELLAGLANTYFKAKARADGESDEAERWRIARGFHADLLEALGYPYKPNAEPLDGDAVCPTLLALQRDGNPFLWVLDVPFVEEEDDDPLAFKPLKQQLPETDKDAKIPDLPWRDLLDEQIFRIDHPPRWVLFLSGSEALLIEKGKWLQGRYLRFRFGDLFSRRQTAAMRAMAGLLHRDVLAPEAGLCLHDTLDESSHKHAYAVSGDLKHGVRRSVELLANEAVYYRQHLQKQAVYSEEEFAQKLTSDCLTWLYRLLFLFYVEARSSDLGAVPMNSDAYRKGYSLENLRDLELVPLTTEHARNGYFINESLSLLFRVLNEGFPTGDDPRLRFEDSYHDTMELRALASPLFDDDRLELLKGVRFRNFVLQQILQLLSLSAEKKKKTRGRISYAQLGINQLGAVYEGLLSYTGFFAAEDLYEVASEKDNKKLSGKPAAEREALKTYFVPASKIGDYKESEIVRNESDKKVIHPKGTYIFRLAGRNREKSASYYTPEVLTQCLVKYALKELLWEEGDEGAKPTRKKTADEILALTICEPAMGSSAFLIEAVDQLADAYLEAQQEEVKASGGETIPPEDYQREKRRVKARLATNNCYGVDLNPTAVELAKVSLWLATLHEGGKCPWFGLRLATGNSLVGARREVFKTADVTRRGTKDSPNWLSLVPEPVPLHQGEDAPPPEEADWANWTAPPRPKGTIYHFLLPASGMSAFDKDKVIKQLAPESVKRIKEWRKEFCQPFHKKDAERLEQISDAVDCLFGQVVRERVLAAQETSDRIPVWGESLDEKGSAKQAELLVLNQEEVAASLEDGSSAYRRLKLAMDAWCALWFWPIEEAGLLPDRATWLAQMELILKGQVTHEPTYEQGKLFAALVPASQGWTENSETASGGVSPPDEGNAERLKRLQQLSDLFRDRRAAYFEACGLADIDAVLERDASLRTAQRVADELHFHHWDVRFAEAFARGGGFDLILGNPPWVRLAFSDKAVLSDFDPLIDLRGKSESIVSEALQRCLGTVESRDAYIQEFLNLVGHQAYLGSAQLYGLLAGQKANLYKCFLVRSRDISSLVGVIGLLHPDGIYDDPAASALRAMIYPSLRLHAQFSNELKLFPEIGNRNRFSLNWYSSVPRDHVAGFHISNLVHPVTLDQSLNHDGLGSVPGIKNDEGGWELRGHSGRLIRLDMDALRLFAGFFDSGQVEPLEARLPTVHAQELVSTLRKLSRHPRLGPNGTEWETTREWNEGDRQDDGVLKRDVGFPSRVEDLVFSGPHLYVGTPLNKTPNEGCSSHRAYTSVDLPTIDDHYLPRTVYRADRKAQAFAQVLPRWNGEPLFDRFRHANRNMVGHAGERSLISAIVPARAATLGSVLTAAFADEGRMILFNAMCCSLISDFVVRSFGRSHVFPADLSLLPTIPLDAITDLMITARALRLNCVADYYRELWGRHFQTTMRSDSPTLEDQRFRRWSSLPEEWSRDCPVRSPLERRQLLIEIDVLGSITVGMTIEELLAIYSAQYSVLRDHDRSYSYDQNGRIVPYSTTAAGDPAANLVELAATLKEQAQFDVHAEYHPDGANTQELRKQKIKLGKKEAGVLGVSERCTMTDILAETEVRWSDEDHPEGRPVRLVGLRYTDPGLEPRMERVYPTPWTRCDREADYRQSWAEFKRRLGKKTPEGESP